MLHLMRQWTGFQCLNRLDWDTVYMVEDHLRSMDTAKRSFYWTKPIGLMPRERAEFLLMALHNEFGWRPDQFLTTHERTNPDQPRRWREG